MDPALSLLWPGNFEDRGHCQEKAGGMVEFGHREQLSTNQGEGLQKAPP